jgi:hypothetical protein
LFYSTDDFPSATVDKQSTNDPVDHIRIKITEIPFDRDKPKSDPEVARRLGKVQVLFDDEKHQEGRNKCDKLISLLNGDRLHR